MELEDHLFSWDDKWEEITEKDKKRIIKCNYSGSLVKAHNFSSFRGKIGYKLNLILFCCYAYT